ncbi:MCP methyltransferase/methylesterase, CheR/CheB with PAS/PAC sensor [Beijerinckia indica subsp. indica ATCC 9039]|uniref:Blue-light-activated histidine kinase n=2 Tax=Beijerinckia TaxID=532 RepID=B2IGH5_BEII9|nr:MCP methyltransferase/methylesterase, CheR/CheB with PAS/PAC sensor [Beijerinckia indica subsp. indica ATCC 9039]
MGRREAVADNPTSSESADSRLVGPEQTHLIIGLGASVGGLDAFKTFFSKMPTASGMSFVLVQHLDPNFNSSLVEIVTGFTAMPVQLAQDGTNVAPDQVYVIPPDSILTIESGILHVTQAVQVAARRTIINTFLTSLAEDHGENAVGIILSGYGSDGALGIEAIKEHGGLTISQAEFDHHAKSGMPQSAVSSGFVDHVLPVEDMPAALMDYRRHRAIYDSANGPDGIRRDMARHLPTICAILHSRLGRDFSQYKTGTLMRRIQRRMHVLQTGKVSSYIEQLRTLPKEAESLFRELLIGVTYFFRNPESFEALETKILPGLLADNHNTGPVRIWVPGCATGEEAYSLAIILKESMARLRRQRQVQIFATDVDDRAIEFARAGLYNAAIASHFSAERLEKNFVKDCGNYRVAKDIREMCLFSTHDLVRDPPFSRLDLVSCRNLLIYFESALQQRCFTTFHYALRPGGHLLLGPSESVPTQSRLFAPVDKRHRIYVRRDTVASFPTFPLPRWVGGETSQKFVKLPAGDDIERQAAHVIAQYAPAYVIVDRGHNILRFSGQIAKYLEPTTGVASLNLFTLLHTDLRPAVRAALKKAVASGATVQPETVSFGAGGQYETLNLIVEPLPNSEEVGLFLILFQDVGRFTRMSQEAPVTAASDEGSKATLQDLNSELRGTRERLRKVTEELEAANEELQSSSEEYLSVNEELQSTNEELETSKEELQSLNEELQTMNSELNNRNESLVRSNSDLSNLFDSTSIAILFLDSNLCIRRFTSRFLELFNVREGDEGRPISNIVTRLTHDSLVTDAQQVLRTLTPVEREVSVANGPSFLMQIRPYRSLNNVIDGVVVTFVDITERKQHEQARALLAAIVESSQDAIISHDLDGTVTSWNTGAERLFDYSASEAIGQPMSMLLGGTLLDDWANIQAKLQKGEQVARFDSIRFAKGGRSIDVSITISPVKEIGGRIVGASVVARDITDLKDAEQKTALLLSELDHRVKNILAIVSAVVSQTLKTSSTPEAFAAEIEGRIKAITMAHSLLTQAGQGTMSLRAVIETELAPYRRENGNFIITGRDVLLTPKAGLALAMAVHELASNAAKYGALSTSSGHLHVIWEMRNRTDNPLLLLTWTESGGPEVQPPLREGFGTMLIEKALTYEFDAEVQRNFLRPGLCCTFKIPLTPEFGYMNATGDAERETR